MDFGLAAFVDQVTAADIRSGTPAYMAPEQLAGKEVTEKSDIYSLGLVLYEVFTGKSAYSAENLAVLVKTRNPATVSRPSSIVKDIDPLVERVILRCLELDPSLRPPNVLTVAAGSWRSPWQKFLRRGRRNRWDVAARRCDLPGTGTSRTGGRGVVTRRHEWLREDDARVAAGSTFR